MNRDNVFDNNLFFVCSLIEYISRKTKNTKKDVINMLGKNNIQKLYTLADVYHCEVIEKVASEFIDSSDIKIGNYDYIDKCNNNVPTFWEIGKVYARLIIMVNDDSSRYVDTLIQVLSSWIIEKIDNYSSSLYYENPGYIYECYKEGKII